MKYCRPFAFCLSAIALALSSVCAASPANLDHDVIGYYNNWDTYGRNYQPSDIPINELSAVYYAFAEVGNCAAPFGPNTCNSGSYASGTQDYKLYATDPYSDFVKVPAGEGYKNEQTGGKGNMKAVIERAHAQGKLALLSIGGYTLSDPLLAAYSPEHRDVFIKSIIHFLDLVQADAGDTFDGVDIDWEPNDNHWTFLESMDAPQRLNDYLAFLQELHDALVKHAEQHNANHTQQIDHRLTIAIPASPAIINRAEAIVPGFWSKVADRVHSMDIMTYDYHGAFDSPPITNFLAPLTYDPAQPSAVTERETFNIDATLKAYEAAGAPRQKIVLGIPAYGRAVKGVPETNGDHGLYEIFDTNLTNSCPGQFNDNTCTYNYRYIVQNMLKNGFTEYTNTAAGGAFAFNPSEATWVSYDNVAIAKEKAELILNKKYAGAMIWSLSGDFRLSDPEFQTHALSKAVHDVLNPSAH